MSAIKMIAVYPVNSNGRGKAEMFVTRDTAIEMVDARLATWGNKKFSYIKLVKKIAEIHRPAPSLSPNVRVMDRFVEGEPNAVAIIDAYKHKYAA